MVVQKRKMRKIIKDDDKIKKILNRIAELREEKT